VWILFLGDVVGEPGRRAAREFLSRLPAYRDVDLVVANGENLAGGMGITPSAAEDLFAAGVDVLTGGNHMWDKREGLPFLASDPRILRPANYPPGVDGRGAAVVRGRSGTPWGVVSLIGRVFLGNWDCPFRWADERLAAETKGAAAVVVDFHAEATSEKVALGIHLDGKVAAFAGTHTHVQTSDARILPGGTGYLTDAGMCGPVRSVIGMDPEAVLRRFRLQIPTRFEVGKGEAEVDGVFFRVDPDTGKCREVSSFRMNEPEMRSPEAWKRFSGN
jgi:metallophosphoesterase (TIGR00282 family)